MKTRSNLVRLLAAVGLAASVCSGCGTASRPHWKRVLTPESGSVLGETFVGMKPALVLKNANVGAERVDAELCDRAGACFGIVLRDRYVEHCQGDITGPFCVEFPGGKPGKPELKLLEGALGDDGDDKVWKRTIDQRHTDDLPAESLHTSYRPQALAVALAFLPMLVGFLLFRPKLQGHPRRNRAAMRVLQLASGALF